MFWKIEKNKLNPYHPRQWSITFRLTMLYTLTAFCILVITALALYWIFTARLEKDNVQFLKNNILIVQELIQKHETDIPVGLHEEVVIEPPLNNYYTRILDENGKTIIETPDMQKLIPSDVFSDITPTMPGEDLTKYYETTRVKHHRQRYFVLMTGFVKGAQSPHRVIQIAKDITNEQNLIIDYRQSILDVLLIGVLFSAAIGIMVTHEALKPIHDMTVSTQRITIAQLKERINPALWPRELSVLAVAFNEMLDRIEEGFLRLSQFSADLAHELRTPIAKLMGEAEIILSRPRSNDEYREVIESSLEELQRITYMIQNLLFLASAENPQTVLNCVSVDVEHVMHDICDFYEAAAEEKNIKLTYSGKATIRADSLMLRRAISNLVSNALQYSLPGGMIILSVYQDEQHVYITVKDTGIGIAPEHIPYLFNRFYRTDSARSQRSGGTGLGLAIVKFIMDLHKGTVTVESQIGQGTLVTLMFP